MRKKRPSAVFHSDDRFGIPFSRRQRISTKQADGTQFLPFAFVRKRIRWKTKETSGLLSLCATVFCGKCCACFPNTPQKIYERICRFDRLPPHIIGYRIRKPATASDLSQCRRSRSYAFPDKGKICLFDAEGIRHQRMFSDLYDRRKKHHRPSRNGTGMNKPHAHWSLEEEQLRQNCLVRRTGWLPKQKPRPDPMDCEFGRGLAALEMSACICHERAWTVKPLSLCRRHEENFTEVMRIHQYLKPGLSISDSSPVGF